MSWTVTKDGISVSADTEAELAIALAVMRDVAQENPVGSVHLPVAVNAPSWRVGGPPDGKPLPPIAADEGYPYDVGERVRVSMGFIEDDDDPPVLTLVSESDDSVTELPTVQHIPVRAILLDVLNVILLFPEGVEARGVCELTGFSDKAIGNRIQRLKNMGLVEKVPHHRQWRATQLARRAKLVKC
jgi:hypothetical protein